MKHAFKWDHSCLKTYAVALAEGLKKMMMMKQQERGAMPFGSLLFCVALSQHDKEGRKLVCVDVVPQVAPPHGYAKFAKKSSKEETKEGCVIKTWDRPSIAQSTPTLQKSKKEVTTHLVTVTCCP
jgi:hypothetical protein